MRIFCGLTNVEDVVAAALVNERGGVVATAEVGDNPSGYVELCRMWVRHADLSSVCVADDGSTQNLTDLSRAGGQPTATAEAGTGEAEDPLDTAVHIARLLATGELAAITGGTRSAVVRRLVAAVQALAGSSHAGQAALIELLRQCHPATLAAWDDPTDTAALAVLCAMPEPADAAEADPKRIAEQLNGVVDARKVTQLVTSLAESSRSHDYRPDSAIAESIAAAAESVLAGRRSTEALAESLTEHMAALKRRRRQPASDSAIPQPRGAGAPAKPRSPAAPPKPRTATGPSKQRSPEPPPSKRPPAEPRRSEPAAAPPPKQPAKSTDRPAVPPPLPNRAKPGGKPPGEPLTVPLPMRPTRAETTPGQGIPVPPPATEEPTTGGFPRMPEPPEFVEPLTTDFRSPATSPGPDLLSTPVSDLPPEFDEADDDLLIFSQARSAWFKGPAAMEDDEDAWSTPADEGWRAAAAAATSEEPDSETTGSGLPRRVPQANLVPGSAIFSDAPATPIKRDASALARHTAGYFRGWGRARRETVGAGSR